MPRIRPNCSGPGGRDLYGAAASFAVLAAVAGDDRFPDLRVNQEEQFSAI